MTTPTKSPRLLFWPIVCLTAYFIVWIGLAAPLKAGSEINTGYFGNVAIKGYDPVAYFTEGKAIEGSENHVLKWLGAKWRFTSDAHKQTFADNPVKFTPQYGGHCAVGTSSNTLTNNIDPEAWAIIDGKLYLNYSKAVNRLLNRDRIEKADANWKELRNKAAR
jgi:YHS domain-containing protein